MKKEPSVPLTISRNRPLASFRATTATPGSTAFWASMTRPRNSPVPCWANAGTDARRANPRTKVEIDAYRYMKPLRVEQQALREGNLMVIRCNYNEKLAISLRWQG